MVSYLVKKEKNKFHIDINIWQLKDGPLRGSKFIGITHGIDFCIELYKLGIIDKDIRRRAPEIDTFDNTTFFGLHENIFKKIISYIENDIWENSFEFNASEFDDFYEYSSLLKDGSIITPLWNMKFLGHEELVINA